MSNDNSAFHLELSDPGLTGPEVLLAIKSHNLSSLVETYLPGKEYSVGIFQDSVKGTLRAMPIEIIIKKNINGHCILDFNVKKDDEEIQKACDALITEDTKTMTSEEVALLKALAGMAKLAISTR